MKNLQEISASQWEERRLTGTSPPSPLINQAFSVHFLYPLYLCLLISRKKDATENFKPIVGSFSILAIYLTIPFLATLKIVR
jgi:hypothetical protein